MWTSTIDPQDARRLRHPVYFKYLFIWMGQVQFLEKNLMTSSDQQERLTQERTSQLNQLVDQYNPFQESMDIVKIGYGLQIFFRISL